MRNLALILVCLVACDRPAPPPSGALDPQTAAALRADAEQMLRDVDAGNWDALPSHLAPDASVFDSDEDDRPLQVYGREAVTAYFQRFGRVAKEKRLKFKTTILKEDCRGTATMGFCALEFDQMMTVGDETAGPFKFRGTLVSRKDGDRWLWEHVHGSFREFPAPPVEPPPAASPAAPPASP